MDTDRLPAVREPPVAAARGVTRAQELFTLDAAG
jgi:hypothetical protein